MNRILCPYHKESTPSMVLYEDGAYHCFGCGAHGFGDQRPTTVVKSKEDLAKTLEYINSLENKPFRGLIVPQDTQYAYIVWPQNTYYIRRTLDNSEPKYKNPAGHEKPLLQFDRNKQNLIIVEGQINAISLAETYIKHTIVCPGGANDLYNDKNYPYYTQFQYITIVADNDAAGAWGAIKLKTDLLAKDFSLNIKIKLVNEDANDILVKYGVDTLEKEIENWTNQ